MIDLKLDAAGDMDVEGFDLNFITEAEQVAQRIQIKLRTFLGEVALNTAAGVPWFEEILGVKPLDLNRVDAILREQILTTPEVTSLDSFVMDYNSTTRQFRLDFKALSIYGPLGGTVLSPEV